jgi:hypothetical protein
VNLALLLCTAVIAVAGGCASPESRLIVPGLHSGDSFGITMPGTTANRPYTFTAIPVCLDEPGRVEIVGADVVNAHGALVVTRAGVAPWQRPFPGNAYATLAQIGYERGPQVVDTVCGTGGTGRSRYELGLEFRRRGPDTGYGDGVDVRYRVGGTTEMLRVPFAVTLCAIGDTTTRDCRPHLRSDPDPYR